MKNFIACLLILVLTSLFSGCTTTGTHVNISPEAANEIQSKLADKPQELKCGYKRLYEEGERNEVLNLMRLGTDALQTGHRDRAAQLFNKSIRLINRVFADSDQAYQARSLWRKEGSKIFKGESYERVMAHYYSGLTYIWTGDYQNARARFQGGLLQDMFAEEEQFRSDFALLYYLSGWCSQAIGGDPYFGNLQFESFLKLRKDIPLPKPDENVLIVFETGKSPRKLSDGVGHYQLKFFAGKKFKEKNVKFSIGKTPVTDAYPIEDIFWQASTRGGRKFDYILAGKAEFKKTATAIGSGMSELGTNAIMASTLINSGQLQGIGAGLGLLGAVSQIASANANAEADIRYWNNLPDMVHLASLKLSPGNHLVTVNYCDKQGNDLPGMGQQFSISVPETGRLLHWVRSRQQITCR